MVNSELLRTGLLFQVPALTDGKATPGQIELVSGGKFC